MRKLFVFLIGFALVIPLTAMPWTYDVHQGHDFLFSPDSGVPDTFGYVYVTSGDPGGPTFDWIDITGTGTLVTGLADDNVVGPFAIGFDFPYYWYKVDQIYVGSNGYISFSSNANLAHPFHNIPYPNPPNDLCAIYVVDLDFTNVGECYTYTSATLDTFIISFIAVEEWGLPVNLHTFQLILTKADSTLLMQYGFQNGNGQGANMVGIENVTGTIGLQYWRNNTSGAGAVTPDSGIAVSYIPPLTTTFEVHDIGVAWVDNDISGGIFRDKNTNYIPTATVQNYGNQTEMDVSVICEFRHIAHPAILYADTLTTGTLNPGDTELLTFDPLMFADVDTTYRLYVKSLLAGDQTLENDSLTLRVQTLTPPSWIWYGKDTVPPQGSAWSGDSSGYGNMFVPPTYPFTIDSLSLYAATANTAGDLDFVLMDDDGTNNGPGTILFEGRINVPMYGVGWNTIVVSPPVVINDGAFYVGGITVSEATFSTGQGLYPPGCVGRRAWEFTGSWAQSRDAATQDPWVAVHGAWTAVGVEEEPVNNSLQMRFSGPQLVLGNALFSISLTEKSDVRISIFDLSGRNVRTLYSGEMNSGDHQVQFNGTDMSSGVYFITADVNGDQNTLKFHFVK